MDFVKHECGVAMVRLLKDRHHYETRYGDVYYGLHLLERMMIRQYNRGQDGAGIGCINTDKLKPEIWQIRQEGTSAVEKMEERIEKEITAEREWGSSHLPFWGNLMMGHVRYSTTGLQGERFLHPFRHDFHSPEESLMICGNFHLINTPKIWQLLKDEGINACADTDTHVLLEHIASRTYDRNGIKNPIEKTIAETSPLWDGGFVICGMDTSGEFWCVRDSHGIRPAFWYSDEEKIIIASEKSAISLSAGIDPIEIRELRPGVMIRVTSEGKLMFRRVIEEKPIRECVFERIYFSRADGAEITLERQRLGNLLARRIDERGIADAEKTFFSFVPASARSAFLGMIAYFASLRIPVTAQQLAGNYADKNLPHFFRRHDGKTIHFGRLIEKGKPLRTFISTETGREELVERTYNKVIDRLPDGLNRIVIIDDSIVRGTTLKKSVISLLDTYAPDEIVIVSSTPQVRYPDFYGIDMSRLGELIAFRAAVNLVKQKGREEVLDEIYRQSKSSLEGMQRTRNFVRLLYKEVAGNELSEEIGRMVKPEGCRANIKVVYLDPKDLRTAIPGHTGDWCFSGNYPTSGAYTKICEAYVNYYEGRSDAR